MENLDDKPMLKELASVIDRLDDLLADLQQQEASSPGRVFSSTTPEPISRLVNHWQKLFVGQSGPAPSALQPAAASGTNRWVKELEHLLNRLRHGHNRLHQVQQLTSNRLRQTTRLLQQSDFSPPEADALLSELEGLDAGHQDQLWKLIDCYQTALALCTERHTNISTNYHELRIRLQLLIDELPFSGDIASELNKIKRQLLQLVDDNLLPGLCLQLIELTIEGCRQERHNSTLFLAQLNNNLGEMHHHFAISLSEGEALFDARTHHGHHIAGELRAIGEHLVSQDNAPLKEEIELRMRSINHVLVQHERLQERERSLLNRMNAMEQQIQSLKRESHNFKQQLIAQNDKLLIDNLTQIYNRAAMEERLAVEYRRWLRYQTPLCVALLDIDYFKDINDKYGHLAGDKALRLIARTIQKSLRDSDFVARYGGEEFLILLNNVNPEHIRIPLEKLREQLNKIHFRFKNERVTITASIGATLFLQGDNTTSALERADQALYRAKHEGRDQIVIA
jgi:diguanylate cyclase